eukprot:scaffold287203_cov18-Tisochrysis_lutea.AAC.1
MLPAAAQNPNAMQGPDGKWNTWSGGKMAWDATAICSNNPDYGGRGNPKQGDEFGAAPNIDHTQTLVGSRMHMQHFGIIRRLWVHACTCGMCWQDFVRRDIIEWMQYLQSYGFDGWRFDFVRGWPGESALIYLPVMRCHFAGTRAAELPFLLVKGTDLTCTCTWGYAKEYIEHTNPYMAFGE